jgi:hypothetical protein
MRSSSCVLPIYTKMQEPLQNWRYVASIADSFRCLTQFQYAPIQFYSKSGVVMLDNDAFEAEVPKIKPDVTRQQELDERLVPIQQASPPIQTEPQLDARTDQEDSLSDNSPDDDDEVVRNAFRHLDDANQAEDDDEEQIVFDPRYVCF